MKSKSIGWMLFTLNWILVGACLAWDLTTNVSMLWPTLVAGVGGAWFTRELARRKNTLDAVRVRSYIGLGPFGTIAVLLPPPRGF